jgi:hypothetical protein
MSIGRFDSMAKEFVPGATLAASLPPAQRANETTLRQASSYPSALNTPSATFTFRPRHPLVETSSMSDPTHQFTTRPNTLRIWSLACSMRCVILQLLSKRPFQRTCMLSTTPQLHVRLSLRVAVQSRPGGNSSSCIQAHALSRI